MSQHTFLDNYNIHDYPVPLATVDITIFCIIDQQLHVLLVERAEHPEKGKLALPGGFIDLNRDRSIEETAFRKLGEKTGVKSPYLEQVMTTGNGKRDPRGWSLTILYFALLDIGKIKEALRAQASWLPVDRISKNDIAFDHCTLIQKAFQRLQAKTTYSGLPIEMMPEEFTLTELKQIFEVILNRSLQSKSFRRRVLAAHLVEETGKTKIVGKRPAKLYRSTGKERETTFSFSLST